MARKSSTVTNITDALRCARKVASGKACSMQELKSSLTLLHSAYKTLKRGNQEQKDRVSFLERMLQNMR